LEKYNIENPLPPTIYVLFDSKQEYEAMKTIVLNYEENIINLTDVTKGLTFGEQEQRVEKVINLMNVIQYLSYFLIAITVIIVISFLGYAIRLNFFRFQKQIEVEKLL
jgi:cell division protein FtsX